MPFGGSPQCNWMTLPQATSSPSPPSPSLFPPPPHFFFQCSGGGGPVWCGGGVPGCREGPSKRHLGPDPHLGVLNISSTRATTTTQDGHPMQHLDEACAVELPFAAVEKAPYSRICTWTRPVWGTDCWRSPTAFPRPRQPLFAVPELRELESACRVSMSFDFVTVPRVCF